MGNAEFDRLRQQFEAILNENPSYRAMKPVDTSWPVGDLRVDPETGIAEGIDVVTPDGIRPRVWLAGWRYVVGRFGHLKPWKLDLDEDRWAILRPGHYIGPPIVDGYLLTAPAVFGADVPTPPGRVDAPGTDGVGPTLDGEDGPTRWLLLGDYGYHVSDADTGRFRVREVNTERPPGDRLNPDDATQRP